MNLIRGIENISVPIRSVVETIIETRKDTDSDLFDNFERIVNIILEETNN